MAKPPPDNLGKRQYELNLKTNDAFENNIKFDDVRNEIEMSDVDKFFKIDLAAKYRDVDYIVEVLKAGETLFAYRALKKCPWIFDDEYSHIINPEYLNDKIFPVTSMRVQRLILKTVAMQVRSEDRAEKFYHYCVQIKMSDIALKCLLFTSEKFKVALMQDQKNDILRKKFSYIRYIIGKSFTLLDVYMKLVPSNNHEKTIQKFRYLYPVNNIKYLQLLEQYLNVDDHYNTYFTKKFDNKLSDDIMKKYKDRVFAKPLFYMNNIPTNYIIRNINAEEAKLLIAAILPSTADGFWQSWFYYHQGKEFLDLIPHSEIYGFIKKVFHDKYPNDEFETHKFFYKQSYFKYMTVEQREEWARNQIKSDRQVLGVGKDYLWYAFIGFKEAFEEIKKYVIVTKEPEKRADMLVTLVKTSTRNSRELETLFKHYHTRHVNEPLPQKIYFLDQVIREQNVFEFDDACWESFYSLLLSVELFTYPRIDLTVVYSLDNYKAVTLFYHILHGKEMSEELMSYFLNDFYPNNDESLGDRTKYHFDKLNEEKRQYLYNFIYNFYIDQINAYKNKPYCWGSREKKRRYLHVILKLISVFRVQHIYKKVAKPQKQRKTRIKNTCLSDRQLLRELKKDKNLVFEKLLEVQTRYKSNKPLSINNFLRKIKIYFKFDLTEHCLAMFEELVAEKLGTDSTEACIKAIFELGNESVKVNFMEKYVPENYKIDYKNFNYHLVNTQKAICRNASISLPPVPLANMLAYMNGDYVRECLQLFSVYVAALPMDICIKLVESVLDAPVSIQKHALRLAFQCFSAESLKNISENIWKKTKNVSLRSVIYKALFNRIVDKNESDLHDILISFTLDLHDDDENILFKLVKSDELPNDFRGEYKKATWRAISAFKDREPNIERKTSVIDGIKYNLHIMNEEFVREIIDDHLNTMFDENKLELNYSKEDISALYREKWNLTVEYIVAGSIATETENNSSDCIELAEYIVKKCLKMWNEERAGKYIYQRCCLEFIEQLNTASLEWYTHSEWLISVYERILDVIKESLPVREIYLTKWNIQLVIANRRAIKKDRENFGNDDKNSVTSECSMNFGKEVGKLISEYVHNKLYFSSVSDKIKELILKRIDEILSVILYVVGENTEKYLNTAIISCAVGMVEFNVAETYLLAFDLLPKEVPDSSNYSHDMYQAIIDKALQYPHPEVQYSAHQKLIKPLK